VSCIGFPLGRPAKDHCLGRFGLAARARQSKRLARSSAISDEQADEAWSGGGNAYNAR
jgi:hypothetical protein